MSLKQSLTTAYQPQADEQAKVSNQMLEISLHVYIELSKNNWALQLDPKFLLLSISSFHRISPSNITSICNYSFLCDSFSVKRL
jgi:hypothetical protein